MDLAIVVVSYNTRDLTADCLNSVYGDLEGSGLSGHIWVIDNASSDSSAEMVAERFPQTTLIAQDTNLGFAAATNLGVEAALAQDMPPRYVMLLNPDTIVRPGALEILVAFMDKTPSAGAAGARLFYGDGTFQHSAFRFPSLSMAFLDFWMINHRLLDSRLNGRYPRRLYELGEPFIIDHPLGALSGGKRLPTLVCWTKGSLCTARRSTGASGPRLPDGISIACRLARWCIWAGRAPANFARGCSRPSGQADFVSSPSTMGASTSKGSVGSCVLDCVGSYRGYGGRCRREKSIPARPNGDDMPTRR